MAEHLNRRVTRLEERVRHLERTNTPPEQEIAGDSPQGASAQQGYSAPRQPTSAKDKEVKPTPDDASQAEDPWYKTLEGWYYVFGIIGIGAAIVYARLTYFLWQEAARTNSITLELFQRNQRALIKANPKTPDRHRGPNDPIELSEAAVAMNIGKTTAKAVVMQCFMEIVPASEPPSFNPQNKFHFTARSALIFPEGTDEFQCAVDRVPRQATPQQQSQLTTGASYLAMWGRIDYLDEFGPHWTTFCWWEGLGGLASVYRARLCTEYNQVDNNYKKP